MRELPWIKCLIAITISGMVFNSANAQITINNTLYTTNQLVNGVLVPTGSGTVVSNVAYQGVYNVSNKYQVGYFTTATTTLVQMGFTSGVVLSTGNTSDIPLTLGSDPRAAAQMSTGYTSTCANGEIRQTGTCPVYINDVDVLAGAYNYFNASILEFDFVPVTNFAQFRYIFGSEEYEDNSGVINYQCSSYNDKFGFLISGPGITGGQGYTNDAKNIARLANGSEVSINSVNNGVVGSSGGAPSAAKCQAANSGWVQNVSTAEYLGSIDGTELNGNTRILTAQQNGLTPGQTYHIKLIVTDVSDGAYDAVVYLEAGSFITSSTANAGANQSLCSNSTTLNASAPTSGNWSVVSGNASFANASSPSSSVTGLSIGANVLKWSNGTDSATVTVTVNTPPNITPSSTLTLTCATTPGIISASSNAAGATYNWSGAGILFGGNTSTPTVNLAGTYSVTVTNPSTGCSATSSVLVNENTTAPNVSLASSGSLTCTTSSVIITASSTTNGATYNWGSGSNSSTLTVSSTGTYSTTVTDPGNGCTASASLTVTSNGGAVNFTHIDSNTTCGSNNGSISVTVTAGNSPYTYNWSNGNNSPTISNLTAGTYSLTISDQSGCSATTTISISSSAINNVTVSADTSIACSGDSTKVCATSGFSSYQWNNGATTACFYAKLAGNYYVTATDANNCTAASNHFAFSVYPLPPVSISLNGDTLTAYNSNSYQWYIDNTIIPGAVSPVYIASQSGLYSVVVSDTNGCRALSNQVQIVISGIISVESEDEYSIFPNPIVENGLWNLSVTENLIGFTCDVFDAQGKLVFSKIVGSKGTELKLDISKGIYILKIHSGEINHSFKLIKL